MVSFCKPLGRWVPVWVLALGALLLVPGVVADSVLKVDYDCGKQGLQLMASLMPWPPGDRVIFQILDEFGNAKEIESCWACQHWVTTGPQGQSVLVVKFTGCYVTATDNHFHLKVRVLQLSRSRVLPLSQDVSMVCLRHSAYAPSHPQPREASPPAPQIRPTLGPIPVSDLCLVGSGKIQCEGAFTTSMEACLYAGCCYDPSDQTAPCYYGNKATVHCTPDGFFLVVLSRDILGHLILLDTVHFTDPGPACKPQVATESFRLFRFPLGQCGTTVQMRNDRVVYENKLISGIDVQRSPDAAISRDSTFMLHIRCSYTASDSLPMVAEVFMLPPLQPVTEAGPLHLEMRIAKDALYSAYFSEADYPVVKFLRDQIYVEVRLLQQADPNVTLVLEQCWAAQTANPVQALQWPLLLDGCPFSGDNYQTSLASLDGMLPFPSHYSRFTVATFAFLDSASSVPLGGEVFFFCSASVCHPSPAESCVTLCLPPRARRKRFLGLQLSQGKPVDLVVSPGPVSLKETSIVERNQGSLAPRPTSPPMDFPWLPLATGVATGMAVSLLALAVVCWRRLEHEFVTEPYRK